MIVAGVSLLAGCVFVLGHLVGPILLRRRWIADCLPQDGHRVTVTTAIAMVLLLSAGATALRLAVPRIVRTVRERRRHREMLDVVAGDLAGVPDVRVLEHPTALVYCLPARERPIVVTTGALDRLDAGEIAAVLAHERAHLRQRHHLVLMLVDALHAAIPWLGTLRLAHTTLPGLLELAADDSAVRRHGTAPLVGALQKLAVTSCSAGALAGNPASSQIAELRVARLRFPHAFPRPRYARPLSWMAVTVALGVPASTVIAGIAMLPLPC